MRFGVIFVLFMSVAVGGCSIHPLPKDVSREDTASIVRNIRCEAKFQVIKRVKQLLEESPVPAIRAMSPIHVLDDDKLQYIKQSHPIEPFFYNGKWTHPKNIARILSAFRSSVIGYTFDFQITENNNLTGGAGFSLPFTAGSAGFGTTAGLKKTRAAQRKFSMQETFDDLRKLRCNNGEFFPDGHEYESTRKKFIYPLTGSISMDEIMNSFIDLAALGNRQSGSTFTDTLTFTTKLNGDINGNVTLTSFPLEKFRLANATAKYAADRQDVHKVTITLAFPVVEFRNEQKLLTDMDIRLDAEEAALELVALEQCINSNKADEQAVGALRDFAPEQYCLSFARRVTALRRGKQDVSRIRDHPPYPRRSGLYDDN